MCGIVGLFLKNGALQQQLGTLLSTMLIAMSERGPDSAGFAIYGQDQPGRVKLTLRLPAALPSGADLFAAFEREFQIPADFCVRESFATLSIPVSMEEEIRLWLAALRTAPSIVASGKRMEIYKDAGSPANVASTFGLSRMTGSHAIGHTRMATESAVTTDGAHPFSPGPDQSLVHNGSLSNHNDLRRRLRYEGLDFETENDSEVAAGYISWRMREGATLHEALTCALADLDGFYTFVVGTETGFAVLRDPVACKPALMAETDDYVAFGSEYRALAALPNIQNAHLFEPEPATVYAWER